jgi:cysteine desulfurase
MIYLDHAAATPVSPNALRAMLPYFSDDFFNPSAPYLPAKRVREAYESAKNDIAHAIGAKGTDLVITAGATESINLAFTATRLSAPKALVRSEASLRSDAEITGSLRFGKILTLVTEHAAVFEAVKNYPHELVEVDKNGLINLDDFRKKLSDEVVLVSVSLANNELGTIQPLAEISEILRLERQKRLRQGITTPLYLHSDASQALSLLDINVARLGVDLLTLNAAKCGGPKGVGALYLAHGITLHPLSLGGGQERGLRSGTENVPGAIGFATAVKEVKTHLSSSRKKYQEMASVLRQELAHISIVAQNDKNVKHKPQNPKNSQTPQNPKNSQEIPITAPIFLGNPKHQLANFVPVCFPGLDAERLIYKLEQQEIYLSTGAACAANKGSKSHVLAAIGLSDAEIAGSLRISLGSTNDLDQIREAAEKIRQAVEQEYQRLAR